MDRATVERVAVERQGYSVDETAYTIGCGRTKVFDLLKEGRLRAVKVGARTIIPRSEIERFLTVENSAA